MIIGVIKEIKNNENRVSLTPAGASELISAGHIIMVEPDSGAGSNFFDEDYINAGASISSKKDIFDKAELILKVKEPIEEEYGYFREGQLLFTYLHLAADRPQVDFLIEKNITAIAYETVVDKKGGLPLLTPMSEVAGRMSVQIGGALLQKNNGGSGMLLSGIPGVAPAEIVIVGGGVVGLNAAKMASWTGARVTILDIDKHRLMYLDDVFQGKVTTLTSNSSNIAEAVKKADLLIGAVLIPGGKCPMIVTEEMVKSMKKGSVIVDVAIDQGGCIETIDRVTTHENPTYVKHDVVHYSVGNMPGAVPNTSTLGLTNLSLPYIKLLANGKFEDIILKDIGFSKGVNVYKGKITCKEVADAFKLDYVPLENLL